MIDVNAIVGVTGIFALGVMSPGPNFLVVAQRAVTRGRADALATMLGVVTISMIWASSSLFGISVVFKLFPWTRLVLKLLGAAYLVWFGVRLWRHAGDPIAAAPAGPGGPASGPRSARGWRRTSPTPRPSPFTVPSSPPPRRRRARPRRSGSLWRW
jgi:threonine/homoserine/homoserine lactone efflux protein